MFTASALGLYALFSFVTAGLAVSAIARQSKIDGDKKDVSEAILGSVVASFIPLVNLAVFFVSGLSLVGYLLNKREYRKSGKTKLLAWYDSGEQASVKFKARPVKEVVNDAIYEFGAPNLYCYLRFKEDIDSWYKRKGAQYYIDVMNNRGLGDIEMPKMSDVLVDKPNEMSRMKESA